MNTRRPRRFPTRFSATTAAALRPGRRYRHHAVPQPTAKWWLHNPTNGGPADTHITKWIEAKANELLANKLAGVKRISYAQALKASTTHRHDYLNTYVADLINVIDFDAIRTPSCVWVSIRWVEQGALLVGDCRALPPGPGRGEQTRSIRRSAS
jgi:hypothetical protein